TNDFKEEHYRRLQYANDHFSSGVPGRKTDRGRIYIAWGPPDGIEDHSSGGFYERPSEEGGGNTSTYPFQIWRYRHMEGIGEDINLEFVDPSGSGEFHLTIDAGEKDALLQVPGAGLTLMEQWGYSSKAARFSRTDGTHVGEAFGGQPDSMNEFRKLEILAGAFKAPPVSLGDLEHVRSIINYNVLPVRMQEDYFPITDSVVQTNITVQFDNKDLQFTSKDSCPKAVVHITGRVSSMTGRRVAGFEETVTVSSPAEY